MVVWKAHLSRRRTPAAWLLCIPCTMVFGCNALVGLFPADGDDSPGSPQRENLAPTAAVTADGVAGAGNPIRLDASGSFDPDGEIVTYSWDLGNGTIIEGQSIEHVYPSAGTFEVVLTVIDDEGASSTTEALLTVEPPAEFRLTVDVEPPEAASVRIEPDEDVYPPGSYVAIDFDPAPGFELIELNGDVTRDALSTEVLMDADRSVTAVFAPVQIHIEVSADPPEGGTVTLDPPGGVYDFGSTVLVRAAASAGFVFDELTDDLGAAITETPTLELVADRDYSLVARFQPTSAPPPPPVPRFDVSVDIVPPGGGIVALDPPGGFYDAGSTVMFTAAPADGFSFAGYGGDAGGIDPVTTLTVNADLFVTAEFEWSPAIGNPGNLLVSGFLGGNVTEFDRFDGTNLGELVAGDSSGLSFAGGLAIGSDGDLFVVDVGIVAETRIVRYDASTGDALGTFVTGAGSLGFITIQFGPNDNLFVANNETDTIEEYDGTTGAFVRTFVDAGAGGLDNPVGMRFGPDGNLFVVSKGTDSVLEYDGATGAFQGVLVDLAADGFSIPVDLALGPDDAWYVSVSGDESVVRVDPASGTASPFVPAGAGGLATPGGVLFHPDSGDLLVVSQGTSEVLRYEGESGAFSGVFASGAESDSLFFMVFRDQ